MAKKKMNVGVREKKKRGKNKKRLTVEYQNQLFLAAQDVDRHVLELNMSFKTQVKKLTKFT